MRKIKFINHMVLCVAAIVTTSCGNLLDLAPIDNYGSGNLEDGGPGQRICGWAS